MIIFKFDLYRDGGTIELETDQGVFCFDGRMGSTTSGRLYNGYPKPDNSNIIEDYTELEFEIIESLKKFKSEFYQTTIDYLITIKQK
ncbi:MAG: hypothetical protein O9302_04415 [Cyclobacteriaceae bacterium]|jgi:hypothetical protein|nr:hypothetical protein [Flammeovirgaceae bacterium]MCZ8021630.1 hypothetical protein [Cytophagales bacterium]MCZ8327280.1 hypothetical protein [Cyclobacteriaceae bacterium]